MSFLRKLKRNKAKDQMKDFKKAIKGVSKRIDTLGDNCRACGRDFDNTVPETLSSWVVYVVDDDPRLVCPDCKKEIDELKNDHVEGEVEDAGINPSGDGKT